MPRWTPPSAPTQKVNGCAVWLTILVVGFGLLVAGLSAIDIDSLAPQPADTSPSAAAPCPTRIAEELPSGNDSKLVEAFLTEEHRITLCLTTTGRLYYFGEWRDDRGSGIAMPARRTDDGYEARNPPYRYDIHDGVVTIYKADTRIGQETLTDNPSPK